MSQPPDAPAAASPRSPPSTGSRRCGRALGGRGDLPLRPDPPARRGLLDRHPAADRLRLAARRARLLLHAHRLHRPLPADARPRGLLPDGLGRQRPADRAPRAELLRRALRPVAALRPGLRAAGEAGPEEAGADLPAQLHRAVRAADRSRTRRPSRSSGASSACRSTGRRPTRPSTPTARAASQRAFLRNLARGEAYQAEAPDPVGRHVPHRRGAGRARGPRAARRRTTGSRSPYPTGRARCTSRPPAPSCSPRASRWSPTPTTSATSRCSAPR